ncbi:uroporphyrinogen-III synthase [Streptomyces sp. NPDC048664]|uniref:uroporphyrinogen-III synthase n=1 Tax=Streptomyces sp. NPDC048664 TaxID=3154505 RepID=UPI003435D631
MDDDRQRPPHEPLAGFTVGVTAAERADELCAPLRRHGVVVLHAPAPPIVPPADDAALRATTEQLIAQAPDIVVTTAATGFRDWVEAAEGWGSGAELLGRLRQARLLACGPEAEDAVRDAGLREDGATGAKPPAESLADVLARLPAEDVRGRRVAVQSYGEPQPDLVEALRERGARVIGVPVHRWTPPRDTRPLDRLVDAALTQGLDALAFAGAPAAASVLSRARERGLLPDLLAALRHGVLAACADPVTAAPLRTQGVDTVHPEHVRPGGRGPHQAASAALADLLCRELPGRATALTVAGHDVEIRGHAVLVDGVLRPVPPAGMALLRALSRHPGRVVARAELLRALPGAGRDEHAVETAVARLRTALGSPRLIRTVVKRGYRLALDPAHR